MPPGRSGDTVTSVVMSPVGPPAESNPQDRASNCSSFSDASTAASVLSCETALPRAARTNSWTNPNTDTTITAVPTTTSISVKPSASPSVARIQGVCLQLAVHGTIHGEFGDTWSDRAILRAPRQSGRDEPVKLVQ